MIFSAAFTYLLTFPIPLLAAITTSSTDSIGLRILLALFLVLLNGFFVAAEFAIVKVRASQIGLKLNRAAELVKWQKVLSII